MIGPAFSVIIPAHNEAAVIARCLSALLDGPLNLDVTVVANACVDATADIARRFGVRVVETDTPGKAHALNIAENQVLAFPRVYLDADVVLSNAALAEVSDFLEKDRKGLCVVGLTPAFDLKLCSILVRAYYDVWQALPSLLFSISGSGVYILTEKGRNRFAKFPDILADDAFIATLFPVEERHKLSSIHTVVFPPRDIRTLLKIKTRVWAGNKQLSEAEQARLHPQHGRPSLLSVIKGSPRLWVKVPVYIGVYAVARARGTWLASREAPVAWGRDDTTRREIRHSRLEP